MLARIWASGLSLLCLTGCVTTIIPPERPLQSTTVCIVDHGRHASLVLPARGGAVEFEYGEWKWFALGHDQSPRVLPALFWPTQGTLGRRALPYAPTPAALASNKIAQAIYPIRVSSADATRLREKLEARYNSGLPTEVYNPDYGLTFVKDAASYSMLNNCNHELAGWLEDLGCEIRGTALLAKFRIKDPR